MPKKIRELEAALKNAGFICTPGKGSHRKCRHPSGPFFLTSGGEGQDAKPYQEKEVTEEIEKARSQK